MLERNESTYDPVFKTGEFSDLQSELSWFLKESAYHLDCMQDAVEDVKHHLKKFIECEEIIQDLKKLTKVESSFVNLKDSLKGEVQDVV